MVTCTGYVHRLRVFPCLIFDWFSDWLTTQKSYFDVTIVIMKFFYGPY